MYAQEMMSSSAAFPATCTSIAGSSIRSSSTSTETFAATASTASSITSDQFGVTEPQSVYSSEHFANDQIQALVFKANEFVSQYRALGLTYHNMPLKLRNTAGSLATSRQDQQNLQRYHTYSVSQAHIWSHEVCTEAFIMSDMREKPQMLQCLGLLLYVLAQANEAGFSGFYDKYCRSIELSMSLIVEAEARIAELQGTVEVFKDLVRIYRATGELRKFQAQGAKMLQVGAELREKWLAAVPGAVE